MGLVLAACPLAARSGEVVPTVWAHCPYVVRMAVTNRTGTARTVAKVTTSCACLKAKVVDGGGRGYPPAKQPEGASRRGATALPGVMPFELTLDPTGMEGLITKTATVTFDDGSVETMTVRVNVRTRVKLTPGDAAFGVVRPQGAAAVVGRPPYREIVARLTGCAVTNGGAKIVSVIPPENPQFVVSMAEDGLSVVVGSAPRADRRLAGAVAETWHVTTTDAEVPRIPFVVSAQFVDGLSVTPRVLTVDGGGRRVDGGGRRVDGGGRGATALPSGVVGSAPRADRFVATSPVDNRADRTGGVSRVVSLRRDDRRAFKVLSAETMPRKWGDVAIASQPLNGWRISIANIDPDEVRQFSKRPYLRIKTDLKDVETIDIPLRVMTGGAR